MSCSTTIWVCHGDRGQFGSACNHFAESDRERFVRAMDAAPRARMSAVNFVESTARADMSGGPIASDAFDDLVQLSRIEIAAVTPEQAHLARRAYPAYG